MFKYKSNSNRESSRLERQANKLLYTKKQKAKFAAHNRLSKRNNKFVQELRKKATPAEVILGKWLLDNQVYFIFQKGFFKPFHRIVDFYLPRRGIIEVDGGYHLNTKDKDNNKDYLWSTVRYLPTLRLLNEQVLDGSFEPILREFIGGKHFKRDLTNKSKYPEDWDY